MPRPILEVEGLGVRYGAVTAVRETSLSVLPGEVVAILGVNGAGKSSVLNAIAGVIRPVAGGDITFDGADITKESPESIVKRGLCLCPEGRRIFAGLTVRENLRLAGGFMPRRMFADRLEEMMSRFPALREKIDAPGGHLSGGQQQMLALGRALIRSPQLLLLDEPSLGLAPKLVRAMFELISGLAESGVTMLIVEQNVRQALDVAARVYVMESGSIAQSRTAAQLRDVDLESSYLGGASAESGQASANAKAG